MEIADFAVSPSPAASSLVCSPWRRRSLSTGHTRRGHVLSAAWSDSQTHCQQPRIRLPMNSGPARAGCGDPRPTRVRGTRGGRRRRHDRFRWRFRLVPEGYWVDKPEVPAEAVLPLGTRTDLCATQSKKCSSITPLDLEGDLTLPFAISALMASSKIDASNLLDAINPFKY